ncbi:Clp protease N-terminal domain-containing protein [Streptomyces sp. NPDC050485]|uniref:Clp protease N-terminal domain-containing protein n=1 Tax=Streptomyces sp. NPDC050485 TaxID=3365617 RepID=UPI0037BADEFC
MFERFTTNARGVVEGAVGHAARAGSAVVTEEHLLLALLDRDGSKAAFALTSLGVTDRRAEVTAALADARRRGGMSKADVNALAGLGISVEEIVAKAEEAHGPGALSEATPRKAWPSGRPSFTRESKKVLEKSLRMAAARKHKQIGDEHMLLALTAMPGVVAEVLAEYGGTYGGVERVLFGAAA